LQPGEILSARVQRDDEPISQTGCLTLFFIHSQPAREGTSTSLGWYFGGVWRKDFGESEAGAAVAQLRHKLGKPVELTAGKPLPLFSVTNGSGHVLTGYAELARYVPKAARDPGRSAPKPQAILHVRRFAAYLPSLDYAVKLPPGFGLRPSVTLGQVTTHSAPSAIGGDYHSSWFIPMDFRRPSSPSGYQDLPAQMSAQRALLDTRFQELQDLGPIPVVLGEPYPVFSLTNQLGEVLRACFELVAPSATGATNGRLPVQSGPNSQPELSSGLSPGPLPPPRYLIPPQNSVPIAAPKPLPPAAIDPATGLAGRT
jgi:hypothetical protein